MQKSCIQIVNQNTKLHASFGDTKNDFKMLDCIYVLKMLSSKFLENQSSHVRSNVKRIIGKKQANETKEILIFSIEVCSNRFSKIKLYVDPMDIPRRSSEKQERYNLFQLT